MRTILSFMIFLITLVPAQAQALPSLTIDLESGRVLQAERAFDPWHPASLTKMMTAYTTFRAIADGTVDGSSAVIISREATRQPPSKMGYGVGTTLTLTNAITILLVKSANDVAVALAESVSGSERGFVARMNADAARLGMTGSRFTNPHGLHDPAQVVTARDMALLTRALHREFPQYAPLFAAPSLMAPKQTQSGKTVQRVYFSYNLLLERFQGADGFKTGFVCASGYNFIGSATRSGRRIAAIVLGRDGQTARAVDAARLIAQGFQRPFASGTPIERLAPNGPVAAVPRNMRATYCTPEASAARYDPGAGQAVIESQWLQPRAITRGPIVVTLEPKSAAPVRLDRIPLPTFRPQTLGQSAALRITSDAPAPNTTIQTPAPDGPVFQRPVTRARPITQSAIASQPEPSQLPAETVSTIPAEASIDDLLAELAPNAPRPPVQTFPAQATIPTPTFRPSAQ